MTDKNQNNYEYDKTYDKTHEKFIASCRFVDRAAAGPTKLIVGSVTPRVGKVQPMRLDGISDWLPTIEPLVPV